jgi:hexosaminidase
LVRSKGKKLRIWNDQLFPGGTVELNPDIVIDYWGDRQGLSSKELVEHGHSAMNSDENHLYYIVGGSHPDPQHIYEDFKVSRFADGKRLDARDSHLLGAQFSIWADNPGAESEDQIAAGVAEPLRSLAQLDWAFESQGRRYAEFRSLSGRVGEAPGRAGG